MLTYMYIYICSYIFQYLNIEFFNVSLSILSIRILQIFIVKKCADISVKKNLLIYELYC